LPRIDRIDQPGPKRLLAIDGGGIRGVLSLGILEASRRRCFVVSPIGQYGSETRNHMDVVFHCIIEPALSDRYEVIRGDYITRPGRITEQLRDEFEQLWYENAPSKAASA
jgi:hypothetical protein